MIVMSGDLEFWVRIMDVNMSHACEFLALCACFRQNPQLISELSRRPISFFLLDSGKTPWLVATGFLLF